MSDIDRHTLRLAASQTSRQTQTLPVNAGFLWDIIPGLLADSSRIMSSSYKYKNKLHCEYCVRITCLLSTIRAPSRAHLKPYTYSVRLVCLLETDDIPCYSLASILIKVFYKCTLAELVDIQNSINPLRRVPIRPKYLTLHLPRCWFPLLIWLFGGLFNIIRISLAIYIVFPCKRVSIIFYVYKIFRIDQIYAYHYLWRFWWNSTSQAPLCSSRQTAADVLTGGDEQLWF